MLKLNSMLVKILEAIVQMFKFFEHWTINKEKRQQEKAKKEEFNEIDKVVDNGKIGDLIDLCKKH